MIDKEAIKDWITDGIGIMICGYTLVDVLIVKEMTWVWEGIIQMGIGCFFFILPDRLIADYIQRLADKWTNKAGDK